MERLKNTRIKVVGTKQTQKAIEKGQTQVVYVARDAEERIVSSIVRLCDDKSLELVLVDSMSELGKACGIKVGAAAAAINKESGVGSQESGTPHSSSTSGLTPGLKECGVPGQAKGLAVEEQKNQPYRAK